MGRSPEHYYQTVVACHVSGCGSRSLAAFLSHSQETPAIDARRVVGRRPSGCPESGRGTDRSWSRQRFGGASASAGGDRDARDAAGHFRRHAVRSRVWGPAEVMTGGFGKAMFKSGTQQFVYHQRPMPWPNVALRAICVVLTISKTRAATLKPSWSHGSHDASAPCR